ncbi:hypothetical protein GGR71_002310 [Xanthomonas sp. F1]
MAACCSTCCGSWLHAERPCAFRQRKPGPRASAGALRRRANQWFASVPARPSRRPAAVVVASSGRTLTDLAASNSGSPILCGEAAWCGNATKQRCFGKAIIDNRSKDSCCCCCCCICSCSAGFPSEAAAIAGKHPKGGAQGCAPSAAGAGLAGKRRSTASPRRAGGRREATAPDLAAKQTSPFRGSPGWTRTRSAEGGGRRARRQGVLSFGYFSLHKQRKVTRRKAKALLSLPLAPSRMGPPPGVPVRLFPTERYAAVAGSSGYCPYRAINTFPGGGI